MPPWCGSAKSSAAGRCTSCAGSAGCLHLFEALTGVSLKTCPLCRCGTMVVIETFECTSSRTPFTDTSMTVVSHSPSYLDQPCAITRTGQFCHLQLHLAFPRPFCCALHVIDCVYAAPHPLKSPVPALRGHLFDPSQLFAELQCP